MESRQSTLTEAESLLFPISVRLLTALRYKEANPGGDSSHFLEKVEEEMNLIIDICAKYAPTPPLTLHRVHPIVSVVVREWRCAAEEQCPPSLDKITGKDIDMYCARLASTSPEWPSSLYSTDLSNYAAEQPPELHWWLPNPVVGGGDGPSLLPSPTLQPRAQRRSPPTTKGRALLPVLPLDIVIGVNQPRGTKRSATVAAHIDGPNEDQGEDSEPGPRKAIISVRRCQGRRVRFQSPPESRPKQRLRVCNGPEAALNEMWVAVGEDMCKPCKLVGREVCKPRWKASEACKSCVFCTGKSWSCNPPDSWFEKVASLLALKRELGKSDEVTTGDLPIEEGGRSETTKAVTPTTEIAVAKHQSGHRKGRKVVTVASQHDHLLERNQEIQNLGVMVTASCDQQSITTSILPGFGASTPSVAPSPVSRSSSHRHVPRYTGTKSNVGSEGKERSQQVASQTGNDGGLRRASCDESMGTDSISNCVQRKPRTRNMVVKSAKRIDTNPPKPCARCREADCTCVRSTTFPARRRRKVGTPNHGRAAQAPQPALPREASERPLYDIDQLGIGPLAAAMFWRKELARSEAAFKAAKLRCKFAKGKYEEALAECLAAGHRSTGIEPKAKRKKNGHSRNGNGKARTGTMYDDEI